MSLVIDGSFGEGGGQVLRTSLGLAMVTGTPFRIEKIRAGRTQPGLRNQHCTAAQAAARVSNGRLAGAEVGSQELTFEPGPVVANEYHFDIGTAGSTTLVVQTVLPALLRADGPSRLVISGGTHNPMAPPAEFLDRSFGRILRDMGAELTVTVERPGFFPKGGGRIVVDITPCPLLDTFGILERGDLVQREAVALLLNLPSHIGEREVEVLAERLDWSKCDVRFDLVEGGKGAGNAVTITLAFDHVTEVVTAIGERGTRAEDVAKTAADEALGYLRHGAPVGEHLADQLLIPMALARGGRFRTAAPSLHTTTNMAVIEKFLDVRFTATQLHETLHEISVEPS